jgi:predicted dehydrogenase
MKFNIVLIGFGNSGKRFFLHLKKNKYVNLVKIFVKNKRKIFYKNKNICGVYEDLSSLTTIDAVIIATGPQASYKYTRHFLEKNVPILIEKPFCKNIHQLNIIHNLQKKKKTTFLINYSDLFDQKLIYLLDKGLKKLGKIKSIICNYGHNKSSYSKNKTLSPLQNWISHPISIFLKLCGNIIKFKIINYKFKVQKSLVYEKAIIKLKKNNLNLVFNFSNFPNTYMRNIKIVGSHGIISFDSYENKNNYFFNEKKFLVKKKISSLQNIINIFLDSLRSKKNISNLDLGAKERKLSISILKKIKKKF